MVALSRRQPDSTVVVRLRTSQVFVRIGFKLTHEPERLGRCVVQLVAMLAMAATLATPTARELSAQTRSVALTFDDLPATRLTSVVDAAAMTERLLDQLRLHEVLTIGFVNEAKLDAVPSELRARTALLEAWLEAGHDLGNHTYSHMRLYNATLEDFQADVLRGERITRPLLETRGQDLRYFRHPTLNTGRDLAIKHAAEAFLTRHGYTVAPVTIDNDEYLYAAAYDRARARADSATMGRLAADYVRYMESMFDYCERLSTDLFDREIAQVLLLHANWLNAEHLEALLAMMVRRGYRFVSLQEALNDPAYATPDEYVGSRGPSWLERWAFTRGMTPARPPQVPEWVRAASR